MKMRSIRKKGRALLCVFLCLAMILPLAGCGKGKKNAVMVVENAEDAIVQMAQLGGEAGYENALSELTEKSVATIDGDSYYRLQQNYQGIPVYGRTVVCATDEKGNVTSLTGNVMDIDLSVDLTPTVTEDQVRESIIAYMTEEMGYTDTNDWQTSSLSDENLCIYSMGNAEPCLAYRMMAQNHIIVVSAYDGSVLFVDSNVMTAAMEIEYTEKNKRINSLEIVPTGDYYMLADDIHRIRIYDANGSAMKYSQTIDENGMMLVHFWSKNGIDSVKGNSDEVDSFDPKAIKLYTSIRLCYEFYQETLGLDGVGKDIYINGFINDQFDNKPNGYCISYSECPAQVDLLRFTEQSSLNPDVVGHEYTHAVERRANGLIYESDSGAIMEALSDIFGELIEGWSAKSAPDWKNDWRNMRDPARNGYPVKPSDPNKEGQDYVHGYSTVISHAAYLMWNGIDGDASKKISADDLATLWYRAMLMMPSDCDFITCRKVVEYAAKSMENLKKSQRDCIGQAFDRAGIGSDPSHMDYHLTENSTISVRDAEGKPYVGYTLNISGEMIDVQKEFFLGPSQQKKVYSTVERLANEAKRKYQQSWEGVSEDPFVLTLPKGVYTFTITDPSSPDVYKFAVWVSEEGTDSSVVVVTSFKPPKETEATENITEDPTPEPTEAPAEESIDTKQLTSVVVTENDAKTREITLGYDEKGRISEITDRYLGEAGEADSVSVERYAYDAKGNLIRQESEYPEYGDYTFVDEYVYDNHGNLVSSTIEDSGGWSNNTYEYNSKGQLIRTTEECQIYTLVTEYAYNSADVCTGAVLTYDQFGTVWSVDCTYEYDSQQRLSRIVKVSGEGTETESYEYDDQGRKIKITTQTDWNTTSRTFDYNCRPFVVYRHDSGDMSLELDHWFLYLGNAKMHTDADGYLISAEIPEWERVYEFSYEGGSKQDSTASNEPLVSDAFSDSAVRDDGNVNNYCIPKINIAGDAAEKTNAVIYRDLYDGVYKKIKNRNGGTSGITYSWLESDGIISILVRWAPEDYTGHGPVYFKTYHASSETGAMLSLDQLTQAYGLTVDEFYAITKEKAEALFDQINGSLANAEWAKSYYGEYKSNMTSEKNIKAAMPFISGSGDLCIVLKVYYVGTMECHETLLNLTGTTAPEAPAFS